jgi:broad specificity phosphatase PhoE
MTMVIHSSSSLIKSVFRTVQAPTGLRLHRHSSLLLVESAMSPRQGWTVGTFAILLLSRSTSGLSSSVTTKTTSTTLPTTMTPTIINNNKNNNSHGWSESDHAAIKELSLLQKARLLKVDGLFDQKKKRPVTIKAQGVVLEGGGGAAVVNSEPPQSPLNNSNNNNKKVITKIIHFQRHGQGYHNLLSDVLKDAGVKADVHSDDPKVNPWLRPELVDSPLTETGKEQCAARRPQASLLTPQVIIVSPLLRALQTAKISFADFDDNNNNNNNNIPWIAHEGCREDLGVLVCNQRRKKSAIQAEFPTIQFSADMPEEDTLWHPTKRESSLELSNRIYNFLVHFIAEERPETELAVICHSFWLFNMCTVIEFNDDKKGNDYDLEKWFLTSEIRSLQLTFTYENTNNDDDN